MNMQQKDPDGPAHAWTASASIERLALLFNDGGLLVAEADGTIDGETVASVRADLPKAGRLGRVRVTVLELEPRPVPMSLPRDTVEILRRVRDTPAIGDALRAELDAVLAGAAR